MVLTLIYMPTIRRYRALVSLPGWSVWLDAVESLTAEDCENRDPLVERPLVGRTICQLLLFASERTTCYPRQLFATLEFSSTAMLLCGLMCRVRCPDVSLCYDSSAASDAQCPILCSIRWSCRWLCHVSTNATQHSQVFLHLDLLGMSTSHQCCETYIGCGLRNASISS